MDTISEVQLQINSSVFSNKIKNDQACQEENVDSIICMNKAWNELKTSQNWVPAATFKCLNEFGKDNMTA